MIRELKEKDRLNKNSLNDREQYARNYSARIFGLKLPSEKPTVGEVLESVYDKLLHPILQLAYDDGKITEIPPVRTLIEYSHTLPSRKGGPCPLLFDFTQGSSGPSFSATNASSSTHGKFCLTLRQSQPSLPRLPSLDTLYPPTHAPPLHPPLPSTYQRTSLWPTTRTSWSSSTTTPSSKHGLSMVKSSTFLFETRTRNLIRLKL